MNKLFVIGIADDVLTAEQEQLLQKCPLIIGTKRLLSLVAHLSCKCLEITPLASALDSVARTLSKSNVAVLASGDPLFYGIGRRLLETFPHQAVRIYPALSSIQRACALFGLSWDDAQITSLHGRNAGHIPGLLLSNRKNLILTDGKNSPDFIACQLLDYLKLIGDTSLQDNIKMLVVEELGLENERFFQGTLAEGSRQTFSPLNIVALLVPPAAVTCPTNFGLIEDDIQHSRGLITKNEVRAATLHRLQLPGRGVLWDIGAGSGSLSIEAARINPGLTVYAIEHKEEELDNIKNNIVKFGCYNIVPVFGRAPEVLAQLPAPDRAFIGGSSGFLPAIVELLREHLAIDGRLVINGVIEKTVLAAPELMKRHGFTVSSSTIRVSRTEPDGMTLDFNPITIMTGTR